MVAEPNLMSVIIPTYRRRKSVRRALVALAEQTLPPDRFEVLVAIDGSEDGTRELVAQFAALYQLRGLWQPNRGRAAACNMGLAAARGELIIILDDDMEPAPGFLAAHLAAHARGERLVVLGAVPVALDQARPVTGLVAAKFGALQAKLAQPGRAIHFREFYSGNASIAPPSSRRSADSTRRLRCTATRIAIWRCGCCARASRSSSARRHWRGSIIPRTSPRWRATTLPRGGRRYYSPARHRKHLATCTRHLPPGCAQMARIACGLAATQPGMVGHSQARDSRDPRLERRRPQRLYLYYDLALDYFFWLGALPALRANRSAGTGLTRLPKSAREV